MTTVKAESVTCKCGCAARTHVSAVDMQARVRGAAGRSSYVAVLRCCSSLVSGLVFGLVIARGAAGRSSYVSYVALLRCCSSLVIGLVCGLVIARGAAGRSSQVSYVALLRCCSCRVPLTHSI